MYDVINLRPWNWNLDRAPIFIFHYVSCAISLVGISVVHPTCQLLRVPIRTKMVYYVLIGLKYVRIYFDFESFVVFINIEDESIIIVGTYFIVSPDFIFFALSN